MDVLIKFPSRSRPQRFLEALRKCVSMQTTNKVKYLVSVDRDDPTMTDDVLQQAYEIATSITIYRGVSKNKIHACNRDIEKMKKWDILLLTSDDMMPWTEGWDELLIDHMKINFPDTDGCLWFSDGYQDRICTMSIMGRKYYDRFGYIYNEAYTSLWCDEEYTNVAMNMGKIARIEGCLFKHEHFINNRFVVKDDLYRFNEQFYHRDKQVYEKRKAEGFPC